MSRQPLVVGNWKMNGRRAEARRLSAALVPLVKGVATEVVVCPPFPYLVDVADQLQSSLVKVGAQNCSDHAPGAFTGEVAAEMLVDAGCHYVIVGHSERRTLYQEASSLVAGKAQAAIAAGLVPIVCFGETLEERDAGTTEKVLAEQVTAIQRQFEPALIEKLVFAYEPVWAIGTGVTASPEQVEVAHRFVRGLLAEAGETVRILYGGSVKPGNAAELFSLENVDGGLIGGASLDEHSFAAICQAMG